MFNTLTIAQRLAVMVCALLAIPVLVGWYGLHTQEGILGDFATTYNDRVVCLKQLKIVGDGYAVGIVDNAQKLRNQSQTVAGFLANLQKAQLDVRQQWGDYRATYLTPEEKRLADQAEAAMANANRSVDKLRQIVQSGDAAALQHYVDREMYPALDPVSQRISALVDLQLRVAAEEFSQSQQRAAFSHAANIALIAVGVVVGFLLAWVIVRGLLSELGGEPRDVVALAERIAEGDLDQKLAVKPDDHHSIVASMARMQSALIQLVRNMQDITLRLSNSATELAAASEQVATSAEEQTRAASSMSASVEQLSVSICSVNDTAADVAKDSVSSGELAHQGETIIDETLQTIGRVAEQARSSQQQADLMGSRSQEIANVIQVIRDVAEQTNLLALNAAIEAARAGEQGRGFAVVADEVRKLSERTAQSTTEISGSIRDLLDCSQHVVDNIHHTVDQMETGLAQAGRAREAVSGISGNVDRVKASLATISISLNEQQQAGTSIAANVEQVAQMSEETSAAATQTAEAASQVEQMAGALQSAISRFRLPAGGQPQSSDRTAQPLAATAWQA
ncbi:methyl-accepting chemotaxis protein [Chromobacterium violaceum]|uniref:Probable methyl-accepting chemotaxis protein n=1 Tax=Chromobacterium violaceum (strain ATCC 12472 / DSM 30191 / JCM 1249 / CCUG 213 / NBRC 12614 / NCIMB 9131 / NCTC 9757 / MK) TaxID=243365 RepID=Q7P1E8_CHRVO|nr:methyl-accepting chemotaxis protein [Chromobacterium violaceum]AAQ57944.1 probable methyl-accepting chemotaxis protein [Chromobacterium violaceum ATCC 12472]SUX40471.1 H3 [Chromobacterium violaceum]